MQPGRQRLHFVLMWGMPGLMANALVKPPHGGAVFRFDHYPRQPDPHTHAEWELNLVVRGTSQLLVDSRRYALHPHEAVWLFPDQRHTLYAESADFSMWVVLISATALKAWCRSEATHHLRTRREDLDYVRVLAPETAADLFRWCDRLVRMHAQTDRFNASLHHLVLEAWNGFQQATVMRRSDGLHPAVGRLLHQLSDGTNTERVEALCRKAGLSRSSLSKRFREETGMDITTFRHRVRLRRCLTLFGDGYERNLLDCALEAGFGSYAQFYRVFREHYGRGPREYFARHRIGKAETNDA